MSPSGAEVIRQIKSQVQEVDPAEVSEHLGNGIVLVDVRESDEWDRGHLPGAVHVPRALPGVAHRGRGQATATRASSCTAPPASAPRSPRTR